MVAGDQLHADEAVEDLNEQEDIVLADEFSPDTCRLWDSQTGEKLDKDRFRLDMGGVEEAYEKIMSRLLEHIR